MSMDAAQPKTQSYMAARMSYKPGKNKGLQRKSALELAKERADKAKEKAEKEKETAESDAEKSGISGRPPNLPSHLYRKKSELVGPSTKASKI